MASVTSLGAGSGLDAESIVTKLVALEKQPADTLTSTNTKLSTQVSTWGKIQSAFSTLQDAAAKLTQSDFWNATTATSSDSTALSVTTTAKAKPGVYSLTVSKLAQEQYVASKAYTDKTAAVGEGTIRIELGKYTSDGGTPPAVTFAAKAAATAVDISIGPGDNTLEKIRDRINSANAGVTASIVNDASGSRLVMRGSSGEENAFRVSVTESGTAPGLSALAYTAESAAAPAAKQMTQTQAAQNAQATINGLSISSASNTLNEVVDGISLQLSKVTTSPVNITVAQDTSAISKGMSDFVTAYNSVVSTIRVQTLYDEASKTAGPLQGDATARGLLSQMRGLIGSNVAASSVFKRLSDIGLDIKTDGTMAQKSSKFNDALTQNAAELQKFFANANTTDATQNGFAERLRLLSKQILDPASGAINNSTSTLQTMIKRNTTKIDAINNHAALVETRLRAQYSALDTQMSKLSGLSSYVSAQLAVLNKG